MHAVIETGGKQFRVAPGDVLLLSGPLTHASGMFLQPFLYQGGAILIQDRFDPDELLSAVERWRATYTFMVPTMLNRLATHPGLHRHDRSSGPEGSESGRLLQERFDWDRAAAAGSEGGSAQTMNVVPRRQGYDTPTAGCTNWSE